MKFVLSAIFMLLLSFVANAIPKQNVLNFIETKNAPKSLGAYSQGIAIDLSKGKLIFVSGQIANDPKTGKLFEDEIQNATRQTLSNIEAILRVAGSDLQHVVRMDVFLKDFKDWDGMNEEYLKHFPQGHFPVRQTVQVGMENRIEISCIAVVPNS